MEGGFVLHRVDMIMTFIWKSLPGSCARHIMMRFYDVTFPSVLKSDAGGRADGMVSRAGRNKAGHKLSKKSQGDELMVEARATEFSVDDETLAELPDISHGSGSPEPRQLMGSCSEESS